MAERKIIRCAIYTRKSSDEGLEQDFNSLDAQREACAAYIASQKHEGWVELPDRYDDGGFSGGTMERPGLKQLLADIRAKRVDVIIVYKVDRLTRSLADFAKIVEILDAQAISFVAVTQQFNTTTSMGRLTLSVLLSFAQFEREIAGERIRDRSQRPKPKACGWEAPCRLAMRPKIVRSRSIPVRLKKCGRSTIDTSNCDPCICLPTNFEHAASIPTVEQLWMVRSSAVIRSHAATCI
jgi:site-specific DNA recombinase